MEFLYLTTRGRKSGLPREIEIWFTSFDGRYYVIAEHNTANWLLNLQAHTEVQVRIGDESLQAKARVLSPETDTGLHKKVAELSRQKYGWSDGVIVELTSIQPTTIG